MSVEPVDILWIASQLKTRAAEYVYAGMTMNSSPSASLFLDAAMAELAVAEADYAAAKDLMMALRA